MSVVTTVVLVAAVLATNLLAGLNLGSAFARRGGGLLPADVWITAHQAEDRVFRRIMPPFVLCTLAVSLVAAILDSRGGRWLFVASALLIAFDMVWSISRLVPLNRQIESWSPRAPPVDWQGIRRAWNSLHDLRTCAVLVAAVLATVALALR